MNKITLLTASASILCAGSLFAQTSRIEGTAVGADGRALRNAQVQVQQEKSRAAAVMVRTDNKGRFVVPVAAARTYSVSIMERGALVASAAHVRVQNGQAAHVNLALPGTQMAGAKSGAPRKGKRWVWVPSPTGTSIGGHYEEADDNPGSHANGQNIERVSGNALQRVQTPLAPRGGPGGM